MRSRLLLGILLPVGLLVSLDTLSVYRQAVAHGRHRLRPHLAGIGQIDW